ncbi:hypothetical protein COM96_18725 [Bacillus cereus]|uniref:Uncharacterized protein n=1 Tax=Bacillus cereus TaxID=1396 RepID=A0A2A7HTQ0_BACCE|nr:hypothetical protein COM96_18725 [Bacillus cereus]
MRIAVHGLFLLFGWLEYKLFVIVWEFMICGTYFDLVIRVPLFIFINSRFWCKDKIKENIAHIFLAELYFMLLVQTIDG